jgi:hypothetical protein
MNAMMLGGGLMLGLGLLVMLLLIGIPILLVIVLLGGTTGLLRNQNHPVTVWQNPLPVLNNPVIQPGQPATPSARYCSHCGAGMQADWTHCPQCGAPING